MLSPDIECSSFLSLHIWSFHISSLQWLGVFAWQESFHYWCLTALNTTLISMILLLCTETFFSSLFFIKAEVLTEILNQSTEKKS